MYLDVEKAARVNIFSSVGYPADPACDKRLASRSCPRVVPLDQHCLPLSRQTPSSPPALDHYQTGSPQELSASANLTAAMMDPSGGVGKTTSSARIFQRSARETTVDTEKSDTRVGCHNSKNICAEHKRTSYVRRCCGHG